MHEKEKPEFLKMILAVGMLYKETPVTGVIEIYWAALKSLSLQEVGNGITRHVQDADRGRFMPRPADILYFARPKKEPVVAWSQVERAMAINGAYKTVQFEDEVINAVVKDMGGWPWICKQDLDEPWTQKEFERRYESYRYQGLTLNEPLAGLHELNNKNGNHLEFIREPVLIENQPARRVIEAGARMMVVKKNQ